MNPEESEEKVSETPPEKKPKLTLIVLLSALTGALLTFSIGGTIYHFQSRKALASELVAAKDELKRKTQQIVQSQEQIVTLSRQMHALKDFSVNRAHEVAASVGSEAPAEKAASSPVSEAVKAKPASNPEPEAAKAKPAIAPAAKKTSEEGTDCQLIGKSPADQAATLQRCMKSANSR